MEDNGERLDYMDIAKIMPQDSRNAAATKITHPSFLQLFCYSRPLGDKNGLVSKVFLSSSNFLIAVKRKVRNDLLGEKTLLFQDTPNVTSNKEVAKMMVGFLLKDDNLSG